MIYFTQKKIEDNEMSFEKVLAYFDAFGLTERVKKFDVSSATVALAAQALGVDGCRIAKSLSFLVNESCILLVAAGDAKVDNAKFKQTFGVKAKMLPHDAVLDFTGHEVGGVCPFLLDEKVSVYLDESLRRFETVYPAAGSSNSAVELTIPELEQHSHPTAWVDVCKAWQA